MKGLLRVLFSKLDILPADRIADTCRYRSSPLYPPSVGLERRKLTLVNERSREVADRNLSYRRHWSYQLPQTLLAGPNCPRNALVSAKDSLGGRQKLARQGSLFAGLMNGKPVNDAGTSVRDKAYWILAAPQVQTAIGSPVSEFNLPLSQTAGDDPAREAFCEGNCPTSPY